MKERDIDKLPKMDGVPDLRAAERAVAQWLSAMGFEGDNFHLKSTPRRVVETWQSKLLDGYQLSPETILEETYPAPSRELIIVKNIQCQGLCPHHLLPFVGKVDIAYLPDKKIVGFSKLAELVRCFTHRLTLQETATFQIAQSLIQFLGARGAACSITAQQMCLTLLQPERSDSTITTSCFLGEFEERSELWTVFSHSGLKS